MMDLVTIENNEIVVNQETVNKIKDFYKLKKEIEYQEKLLKDGLMEAMENLGKENFIVNGLSASIRKGTTRTTIDTTRLKKELPDIYEEYSKTSEIKSSITLTISD